MKSQNAIAKIFAIISYVIFGLGGLGGIIILFAEDAFIGLICLVSVFITGMMFLALAEIIHLLQICADNTGKQPKFFTGDASIIADMEAELPKL